MQPELTPDQAAYRRLSTAVLVALPLLTALLYFPGLAAPFFAAKAPVFFLGASLLTALAVLQVGLPRWRDTKLFIVFVVIVLASMSLSRFRYMGRHVAMWYAEGPLLCWSVGVLLRDRLDVFLRAVAAAGGAVATITVLQFAIGHDFLFAAFGRSVQPVGGRMQLFATLGNPSFVATYLAACSPAVLYFAARLKGWRRLALCVVLVLCIIAIIVTGSRAGVFALIIGVTVMHALAPIRGRTVLFAVSALILLGVLLLSGHQNPRSIATSWTGRTVIWRATVADAWRHPLGSGPGTFAFLYPARVGALAAQHASLQAFAELEEHALNDWVELWSDLGPFAVLALLTLTVRFFQSSAHRRADPIQRTLAAMMTALLAASLFDSPLYRPETATLFWICLAGGLSFAPAATFSIGTYARWVFAIEALLAGLFFAAAPSLASYYTQRGRDLAANSYYALAHSDYDLALRYDPSQTDARFGRMQALALLQRYPDALAANTDLLLWANEPEVWLYRAQIAHAMNNDDFAREQLRIAIGLFPYAQSLQKEMTLLETQPSTSNPR